MERDGAEGNVRVCKMKSRRALSIEDTHMHYVDMVPRYIYIEAEIQ